MSGALLVCCVSLCAAADAAAERSVTLPVGSHPLALSFPYFPDRAHAVVFRNWRLVDPERIAQTLRTDTATVHGMARAMGLPPSGDGGRVFSRRGYITVLRRNWHLLPYEQLLTILGMTKERLWFALKEDDFLFHKLGRLKPRCEPVYYVPPEETAEKVRAEIRRTVERHFGDLFKRSEDPRFSFIEELSRARRGRRSLHDRDSVGGLRFLYSYFGSYGDPLSDPSLDPYPDGLLERLAEQGVNGIWLHTVLRHLAPGGESFPEFGEGWERRLESLDRLVQRGRRYGVGVYLYMNEPRAMPASFFRARPEMAGVREGESTALCTTDARVRRWLSDSLAHVFREVPDLAGVFTITASENLTSCASHFRKDACPRCAPRSEAEIIAEVISAIAEGVHRSSPRARVIAWDWGWNRHGDARDTIALLPDTVWLQSVSEWSLPIERGGVGTAVGEYSISAPGPGPRARQHWAFARSRGLRTAAKVQLSATWELASVPFIPALDLVAEHCARLAAANVDGTMLSWTVGGYPSPNLQVAARFAADPKAHEDDVLRAIARERYGEEAAPLVQKAWSAFSVAFREFPFHVSVVYNGPQQVGAANPLYPEPSGYRATMVGIPYDDLDGWRGPYPRDVFAGQFEKVARGWKEGLEVFEGVVERSPKVRREIARADLRIARAAYVHFASVANQAHYIIARDKLRREGATPSERRALRRRLRELVEDEVRLARQQFELSWADARIGFEASNHYFYVPLDCVEKVLSCEYARKRISSP